MSDSEGSDSDGSYGGRKKMRRDEAEEGEEEDLGDEEPADGEDLVDSEEEDDKMGRQKKKGKRTNARDFIIDEAEVSGDYLLAQ